MERNHGGMEVKPEQTETCFIRSDEKRRKNIPTDYGNDKYRIRVDNMIESGRMWTVYTLMYVIAFQQV